MTTLQAKFAQVLAEITAANTPAAPSRTLPKFLTRTWASDLQAAKDPYRHLRTRTRAGRYAQ